MEGYISKKFYILSYISGHFKYLDDAASPTDPEAAELVPGEDAWCGGTDQRFAHLPHGDPGASVLPTAKNDLYHFRAVMRAGGQGEVSVVVGLDCHLELGHPGRLFHILVLVLIGGGNMDSLCER